MKSLDMKTHILKNILFILSGLPASGKSSLARLLAAEYGAVWLRIDTIEQALRELCGFDPQGEGYRMAYRIAADNLRIGMSVVADSCNPIELTRGEWEAVAAENGAQHINIEVVCSDKQEHRRRVEERKNEIAGLKLPTWNEVENREYDPLVPNRRSTHNSLCICHITIDTAGKSPAESLEELKRIFLTTSCGPECKN